MSISSVLAVNAADSSLYADKLALQSDYYYQVSSDKLAERLKVLERNLHLVTEQLGRVEIDMLAGPEKDLRLKALNMQSLNIQDRIQTTLNQQVKLGQTTF